MLGSLGSKSKFLGKNSDWPNSDGLPLLVQSCSWKWGLGRKAHGPWESRCNHVDVQFLEKKLLGSQPSRIPLCLVGVSQACTCTTVQTSQLCIFLRSRGLSVSFLPPPSSAWTYRCGGKAAVTPRLWFQPHSGWRGQFLYDRLTELLRQVPPSKLTLGSGVCKCFRWEITAGPPS